SQLRCERREEVPGRKQAVGRRDIPADPLQTTLRVGDRPLLLREVLSADDGVSVEAKVAIREAMIPGAAFLICGARDGNGNLLTGAVPGSRTIRIEVATPVGQPEGA
ncbi:MAG: hypothetical protein ACKOPI_01350, partial [bacterium]